MTAQTETELRSELEARLARARAEGLVDVKVTIDANDDMLMTHQLLVLNNILRMREDGVRPAYSF